jgi:hypothetical protein
LEYSCIEGRIKIREKKMKKLAIFVIMFLALAFSASATISNNNCYINKVNVHAVDSDNNDLQGVVVAPEWKFGSSGWNDYYPKEGTTDSNGYAAHNFWVAAVGKTLQVNYATLDGYTCTSGQDTRITAVCGTNTLTTVCTPDNVVPEFGVVAGAVALVGALGIFMYRRKN